MIQLRLYLELHNTMYCDPDTQVDKGITSSPPTKQAKPEPDLGHRRRPMGRRDPLGYGKLPS